MTTTATRADADKAKWERLAGRVNGLYGRLTEGHNRDNCADCNKAANWIIVGFKDADLAYARQWVNAWKRHLDSVTVDGEPTPPEPDHHCPHCETPMYFGAAVSHNIVKCGIERAA